MPVEVQLVGSPMRWVLSRSPVRIGRSPDCEVELPAEQFPGVSREHARLQWQGTELRLSDHQSGNGTFVNGERISDARLAVGDTVRLGPDGPELLIRILAEQAAVTMAAAAVAGAVAGGGGGGQTMRVAAAETGEGRTMRVAAAATADFGATMRVGTAAGQAATHGTATPTIRESRPAPPPSPAPPRSATTAAPAPAAATEQRHVAERSMVEMKLATLQRLTALSLAAVLLLLAGLMYLSQQMADTRADLARMRSEAVAAAQHVAPTLQSDQQQVAGMDARLAGQEKAAEDHFVQRMNQELPAMMDHYMDQKAKQLGLPAPPSGGH